MHDYATGVFCLQGFRLWMNSSTPWQLGLGQFRDNTPIVTKIGVNKLHDYNHVWVNKLTSDWVGMPRSSLSWDRNTGMTAPLSISTSYGLLAFSSGVGTLWIRTPPHRGLRNAFVLTGLPEVMKIVKTNTFSYHFFLNNDSHYHYFLLPVSLISFLPFLYFCLFLHLQNPNNSI